MSLATVLYGVENGVATITLNRPEVLNAINRQLALDWRAALDEAAGDEAVRCILITGAGRAFCAGADLKAMDPSRPADVLLREDYHPILRLITEAPKPVIAAINGTAVGAGANLALACDMRHIADTASFGEVFIRIGVIPDAGGHFFLPRLVGIAKAFELMATGEIIDAAEALRLGIVNRVLTPDDLMPKTRELAETMARAPTAAIGAIKRGLRRSFASTLDEMLEFEAEEQARAFRSEDAQEGIRAFLERRPPRFRGR